MPREAAGDDDACVGGIAVATIASLAAATAAPAAPSDQRVRIEGRTATLFEGPVRTDGHAIKASSDNRARPCDGGASGGGANATPTAAADDAMLPLEVEEWLSWLATEKGRARATLAAYRRDFRPSASWPEPRVIVRFWIITVMLVLVGLATLKLR